MPRRRDANQYALAPVHHIKPQGTLTVEAAENTAVSIQAAATRGERVTLDLSRTRTYQIGAAARLGNSLRKVALASNLDLNLPTDPVGRQQLLLSGIGPQLAQYASTIREANKANTRNLRKALCAEVGPNGLAFRIDDLKRHPKLVRRSPQRTQELLTSWLSQLSGQSDRLLAAAEVELVAKIVHEAVLNVQDHSDKAPLVGAADVHSYASLRWRSASEIALSPSGFDNEDPSSLYLQRATTETPFGVAGGFVEIMIVDDGTGVAPRQALDAGIADGADYGPERAALAEALMAGGTVKLRAKDCPIEMTPGYGSHEISERVIDLAAFVCIRTGRFIAHLDGLRLRAEGQELVDETETSFRLETRTRRPLAGTILSILIPSFSKPLAKRLIPHTPTALF